MSRPWESLAGLLGSAARCTCSDMQLSHVGCDCAAEQNLPVTCECGAWLRSNREIFVKQCGTCERNGVIAAVTFPLDT